MESLIGKHWHHLPADEVVDLLDGDKGRGLDLFKVGDRQRHFGPNVIVGEKGQGALVWFLLQFERLGEIIGKMR